MSFPRYPSYKDSGVEWLGEVPSHWAVAPLKAVTTYNDEVIDETTTPDTEIVYVDISSVDSVSGIKMKEAMQFSAAPSRARRRVRDGDVIISTVRTYLKAIARIRAPEENLIVSTGFVVIRPRSKLMPNFLGCLVSASYFVDQVIARSTGVSYPAINASELVAISVPLPPPAEQTKIAAFLDRETAKIDELVAEQRRLMELLKEKRQAIISHAVTKGLNSDAPMKLSGIEWLGEVPAHWEIRKLCNLARLESGHTPSRQRADYWIEEDCVIPWFTLADVGFLRDDRNTFIENTAQKISQLGIENSSARLLPPETVLLSRTASVGFSGITKISLAVSQDFAAWICSDRIHPRYLLSSLRAMKPEFHRLMMGSTHQTIYMPDIEAFRVPVPPTIEQLAIVDFIEAETFKLDTLTTEAQCAIDLLQERRTALISAAVTGQIDVRALSQTQALEATA